MEYIIHRDQIINAKEEINEILAKLESENLDLNNIEVEYKRLMNLNKHIESIFKIKAKKITNI